MSHDGLNEIKTGYISSLISLFASSSTLICCAIPALLVSLGAGATLASLVAVFPKIVWISEHKEAIFMLSSGLMFIGGILQWRNRNAPCPIDPKQRDACLKTRKISQRIYLVSLGLLIIGGWFAFVQPLIQQKWFVVLNDKSEKESDGHPGNQFKFICSRNRRTLSNGLREPNPPTPVHKASMLCVIKCVTQCAHTNLSGGVMSLKRLRIFEKLRAYDSVALTS